MADFDAELTLTGVVMSRVAIRLIDQCLGGLALDIC